jgi:hypothetical protein
MDLLKTGFLTMPKQTGGTALVLRGLAALVGDDGGVGSTGGRRSAEAQRDPDLPRSGRELVGAPSYLHQPVGPQLPAVVRLAIRSLCPASVCGVRHSLAMGCLSNYKMKEVDGLFMRRTKLNIVF